LTGLAAQPLFIAWRLMIHRIHESCEHQIELHNAYQFLQMAFTAWSFVNLTIISFDRHYALAKPLAYRANITKKGNNFHLKIMLIIPPLIFTLSH